jgi:hypothetical protein
VSAISPPGRPMGSTPVRRRSRFWPPGLSLRSGFPGAPGPALSWKASRRPGPFPRAGIAGKGDLEEGRRLRPCSQGWAAEPGLAGPDAIARASQLLRGLDPHQERASRQRAAG